MQAEPDKCFASWSDELKSRSERVRRLIGPVHWLSDGHHKEELIRQFLIRYLPSRFRVTRGFICTSEGNQVSREIDVMVSDSEGELPWFAEGDLVIAPPTSICAQIHVKTEFGVPELVDVMKSGAQNRQICDASKSSLWFGAIFFNKSKVRTKGDLKKIWDSAVLKTNEGKRKNSARFPDCVSILDGPLFLTDRTEIAQGKLTVRAYDCGKSAPAAFLNHLSDSMPLSGRDSTRRGEWFFMLTKLARNVIFTETYDCFP